MAACFAPRVDPDLRAAMTLLHRQDARIDAMGDALEASGDFYTDMRHSCADLIDELEQMRAGAGRIKALDNVARATSAVLHLADTFDKVDVNGSGSIDVAELRRGLHLLGMDSHSAQANAIVDRYTHDAVIDIKVFTTLVRDIHLLLTFDQDGNGTLDAQELKPALEKLGLKCSDHNVEKIVRAWDADGSGKLDLLEFTDLVRCEAVSQTNTRIRQQR